MKFGKQIKDQLERLKSAFSGRKFPSLPKAPKLKSPKLSFNRDSLSQWREYWANGLNNLSNLSLDRLPRDLKISNRALLYMNLAAVGAVSYFTADLAATIVNPYIPEPKVLQKKAADQSRPKTIEDYAAIPNRNLFNKDGLIPDTGSLGPDLSGPAVKSSLPLDLVGIILVKDRLKSVASINDRSSNSVVSVKVDEEINPTAILKEIEDSRIIFYNNRTQRKEFIELPQLESTLTLRKSGDIKVSVGAGITKVSDTQMTIDRSEVDKALGNLNQILTQARCVPHMENGRPAGYRCFQIVAGSIYDKIGMKNGDIICGINGEEIADMSQALQLFEQLKTSNRIELCIRRNRQTMNMIYDIQ